ncbi:MAG: carbonic anhydrase [Acidobacteriaceae bacterium]
MTTQSTAMDALVAGVSRFQAEIFPRNKDLFDRLAHTQSPKVLFLTCSDSRIDPNLITQTGPGDLFVCRNIGNIVPPHGAADRSVATVVEYAVQALGVEHIIVCGHSGCGAMKGLLNPRASEGLPLVAEWLRYADAARRITAALHPEQSAEDLLRLTTQANVEAQLAHLRTYPEVAARLASGKLSLHGWYYDIGSGEVEVCGQNGGPFTQLKSDPATAAAFSGKSADLGLEA